MRDVKGLKKYRTLFISLIVIKSFTSLSAETLVIAYGSFNAEPYAIVENGILKSGIIYDLAKELGTELGLEITFMNIPRKRIEPFVRSGRIHVMLISNPSWMEYPESYNWSEPLFHDANKVAVRKSDMDLISTRADLRNKRIGTILGYYYPSLIESFDKGEMIRDDGYDLDANFRRLADNRIDCLIDSEILIAFYIKSRNADNRFSLRDFEISSHNIHGMFSKQLPVPFETINAAIEKMQKEGAISSILEKYR